VLDDDLGGTREEVVRLASEEDVEVREEALGAAADAIEVLQELLVEVKTRAFFEDF